MSRKHKSAREILVDEAVYWRHIAEVDASPHVTEAWTAAEDALRRYDETEEAWHQHSRASETPTGDGTASTEKKLGVEIMTVNASRAERVPDFEEGGALFRSPLAAGVATLTTTDSVTLRRMTRDTTALPGGVVTIGLDVLEVSDEAEFLVYASDTPGSGGNVVAALTVREAGSYLMSVDSAALNAQFPSGGALYLYLTGEPNSGSVQFGASLQKTVA